MMLDPLAKRLLTMIAAASPRDRSRPTAHDRRQALAKLMQFARTDMPPLVGVDGSLPGLAGVIPYRLYAPSGASEPPLPGFVFFHGGGMVAGSIETHDRICAALAQMTGCRLVSVDYRLAPEHRFPAAIEDAITATNWVSEHAESFGINAEKLVVGGDSAGATLAESPPTTSFSALMPNDSACSDTQLVAVIASSMAAGNLCSGASR